MRDGGNWGFAPHTTRFVSHRWCVAHNLQGDDVDGFTWDHGELTHDTLWEDCLATRILALGRGFRLSGFVYGHGDRNVARRCVAAGIGGTVDASGHMWPEHGPVGTGVWVSDDLLAHNCRTEGNFNWQNDNLAHRIIRLRVYHCNLGVDHGAYSNGYLFEDTDIYACGGPFRFATDPPSGLVLVAVSTSSPRQIWRRRRIDVAGLADYAMELAEHSPSRGTTAPLHEDCTFAGGRIAQIHVFWDDSGTTPRPRNHDIVRPVFTGPESQWFRGGGSGNPNSVIRVQLVSGEAFALRPLSSSIGVVRSDWQVRREEIAPFA